MSFNLTRLINLLLVIMIDSNWSFFFASIKIIWQHSIDWPILRTSYSDGSLFCQSLEENPKCHPQMKGNWLGCSETTQKPTRLRPTMNLNLRKQWKNTGTPVSLSTIKQVSHHHKHKVCWTRQNQHFQGWLKFVAKCLLDRFVIRWDYLSTMTRCMFEYKRWRFQT